MAIKFIDEDQPTSGKIRFLDEEQPASTMEKVKGIVTQGFDVPPSIQKIAQVIDFPVRVGQAVGLSAEPVLRGIEPELLKGAIPGMPPISTKTALEATTRIPLIPEAFKRGLDPEFKPQNTREEIYSTIGEIGAVLPLTLPILSLIAKHPGIGGAVTFGTLELIKEASREGRIVPYEIGKEAVIAGTLPLIKPTVQQINKAGKTLLKGLFKRTAKVDEEALDALLDNPNLLNQFAGLKQAINEKALNVQKAISKGRTLVGDLLNKYKERAFGIKSELADPIRTIPRQSPEELDASFNIFKNAVKNKAVNDAELVKQGLNLRNDIYSLITFKPGQTLEPLSDKITAQLKNRAARINEMIHGLKGGKRLRFLERAYSDLTENYEVLQQKLNTPGKIEDFFTKFLKKEGGIDDVLGTPGEIMDRLKYIEKKTKTPIIKPMINELSSKQLKSLTPQGFSGSILAAVAAALAVTQRPALAAAVGVASTPRGAAILTSQAQKFGGILKEAGAIMSKAEPRALISAIRILHGESEQLK